ncbi:Poly ADP-ribose [Phytophthora cinnamomi]|uniref:Poly ADP-ribose n=1 Tax=Phytophthora cinnamomi TaxID=4785 RepID=UPI00355ABADD|nr:Poly ADP-ribose [Phytophthora cinnamomi]
MPPQNQDSETQVATVTTPTAAPVKNALFHEVQHAKFEHPELLSTFPPTTYDPIPVLPYEDRAFKADPTFKNLLADATVTHLEPKIGSEISGLQLHELTDAQKDELALLIAQRGVVFFRDQKITAEQQLDLGSYYGPLHIQQNLPHTEKYPEMLVVENSVATSAAVLKRHQFDPVSAWHTDVSYERQPPAYTLFKVLTTPDVGGDTLWACGYEAYDRLTPAFKKFIEGLVAVHSGKSQADHAIEAGHIVRRPVVEFEHPVVRTHPVTKRKALFVNAAFTKRIKNLSSSESDAVLRFLYKHVAEGHEFQVRFHWTKNAVAIWDNRSTFHYATFDYLPGNRHAVRVTPHGEVPYFDPDSTSP